MERAQRCGPSNAADVAKQKSWKRKTPARDWVLHVSDDQGDAWGLRQPMAIGANVTLKFVL
jgi:hypothetical protein